MPVAAASPYTPDFEDLYYSGHTVNRPHRCLDYCLSEGGADEFSTWS